MKGIGLLPVLIMLLFSACKKDTTPPTPSSSNDAIPFWKAGNYWNYLVTSGPYTQYKHVEIIKKKKETMRDFSYEFATQSVIRHYHHFEGGFLKSYPENVGWGGFHFYLKMDAKTGDTWEDPYNEYKIESVNDTVKVQAGVFICKKVKEVEKDFFGGVSGNTTYKYYSDQVGLIKCTGWRENYELSDTNVK